MHGMRNTLIGFTLALVLTGIPFALVAAKTLPREATLWAVGICAVVQIVVHLRFFLGIGTGSVEHERGRGAALLFACVLLFIMVGGTVWVMGNLNWRMMY